jgi:hypothetical protein
LRTLLVAVLSWWLFKKRLQQTEVLKHSRISNDNTKVADQLDYLLQQVITGCARDQLLVSIFKQGRQQFADAFDVPESTKRTFTRDKKVFWIVRKRYKMREGWDPWRNSWQVQEYCQRSLNCLWNLCLQWANCCGQDVNQCKRSTFLILKKR